jgi:hypothetical protein
MKSDRGCRYQSDPKAILLAIRLTLMSNARPRDEMLNATGMEVTLPSALASLVLGVTVTKNGPIYLWT